MKNKIQKLIELRKASEPLEEEIDNYVRATAIRWSKIARLYYGGSRDFPSNVQFIESWKLDADGDVTILWDETWNYGGRDSGTFNFKSEYLYDDNAMLNFEKLAKETDQARQELAKETKRLADLKAYEALRVKLGLPL